MPSLTMLRPNRISVFTNHVKIRINGTAAWIRKINGKIEPRQGSKHKILLNIFANPDLPEIDDYYEPFYFDYGHLHNASESKALIGVQLAMGLLTLPISIYHSDGANMLVLSEWAQRIVTFRSGAAVRSVKS